MSNSNIFMQFGTIKTGQIVKLFTDSVGLDALLEYAVMHNDEDEAERLREELRKLTDEV